MFAIYAFRGDGGCTFFGIFDSAGITKPGLAGMEDIFQYHALFTQEGRKPEISRLAF